MFPSCIGSLVSILLLVLGGAAAAETDPAAAPPAEAKPVVQVFYKEMPPSLQTLEKVRAFLEDHREEYEIHYLLMTDQAVMETMEELLLPTEHLPFAVAIEGRTSAGIGGEIIIFSHFPDFMHHLGRHQGNWTLAHLQAALQDRELLLPENPRVVSGPGRAGARGPR